MGKFYLKEHRCGGAATKKYLTTETQSFTVIGLFLDQELFALRPQRLRGEPSETFVLLHQSGPLGDILNGLMFLAYLGDELLRRLVVLMYSKARELRGDCRFLHRLFDGRH